MARVYTCKKVFSSYHKDNFYQIKVRQLPPSWFSAFNQGPDVDILGADPGVVNQLINRVGDLETFAQEFHNNEQLLRLDIFTGPLADVDTEQVSNIISNTLQNWLVIDCTIMLICEIYI